MRGRAWGFAGAAVLGLGLVVFLSLTRTPEPGPTREAQRPAGAAWKGKERPRVTPTPPPVGTLSIRGLVRDGQAPVAGVRVSATRPMPGETISELPCPVDEGETDPRLRDRLLPDCMDQAGEQVLELVQGRYGEAPLHAETVTAADGSFVLEGLAEGEFTLWALGERGVALQSQVAAGAEAVELVLGEGMMLEGRVTDASEHPLSEVRLTVLHAKYARFFDARSGGDGRFQVGPLPKGEYALVAEKEDWLPEFVSPELLQRRGTVVLYQPGRLVGRVLSEGAPAPGTEVRLKGAFEGEQVTKADAEGRFAFEGVKPLLYVLTAQREGRYATTNVHLRPMELTPEEVVLRLGESRYVEGTVRDDAGSPIEGARVSVWRVKDYGQNWKATTDAEGHYRVGPLVLSEYSFDVTAPRYRHVQNEEHKLTRDAAPVDFTLTRASSLSGTIVDEEGAPVPEASLELSDRDGASVEGTESRGTSGEDGRFVLDVPEAGTWTLSTDDDRFLPEKLSVQIPSQDIRWVLRRGARIEGTVTDSQGAPLERVWVTVWKSDSGKEWSFQRGQRVDERGRFSLSGLEAGSYVAEASLNEDGVERMVSRPVQLRDSGHAEISLRFDSGWSFSGLAVDEAGEPLAEVGINVDLPFEAAPPWRQRRRGCGNEPPRIFSGVDGRFKLERLTGEVYELWGYKEGYTFVPSKAVGGEPENDSVVRMRPGMKEVRLVFKSQAHLRGRLVGPEGAPIQRFELNKRFVSDARGAFSTPIQETGMLHLSFEAPGMAQVNREVKVQEGVEVDLGEVRMDAGRRVEGRVVDAETGAPVEGAELSLRDSAQQGPDGLPYGRLVAQSREDGTFELPHVEAQPFQLEVSHPNYRKGSLSLGTANVSVTVRLDPGAAVEVSVRDSEGRPLDADVRFVRDGDTSWESLMVEKGLGLRRGLEPGSYVVQVRAGGEVPGVFSPQRVSIPAQGQVKLAFVQRKEGATLVWRVEGNEEVLEAILVPGLITLPVTVRTISLWGINSFSPREDKGVKSFPSLPPGRARLLLFAAEPPRFHLEELELPAEGTVEKVVQPRWQLLPDE